MCCSGDATAAVLWMTFRSSTCTPSIAIPPEPPRLHPPPPDCHLHVSHSLLNSPTRSHGDRKLLIQLTAESGEKTAAPLEVPRSLTVQQLQLLTAAILKQVRLPWASEHSVQCLITIITT